MSSSDSYSSSSTLVVPMDVDVDMELSLADQKVSAASTSNFESVNKDAFSDVRSEQIIDNTVDFLNRRQTSPDVMSVEELSTRARALINGLYHLDARSKQYKLLYDELLLVQAHIVVDRRIQTRRESNEVENLFIDASFLVPPASATCNDPSTTDSLARESSQHRYYSRVPEAKQGRSMSPPRILDEQQRDGFMSLPDMDEDEALEDGQISDEDYDAFCAELEDQPSPDRERPQVFEEEPDFMEDDELREKDEEDYLRQREVERRIAIQVARGYEEQERRRSMEEEREMRREVQENKDDAEWLNGFLRRHGRGGIF
ncbi:hypothetical protein BT69DRAFT_1331137 [Atractiella rhizophila]|nr:hypothetical protein BT69DRAFT_1331137 [Atractiella rhizophila]